MNKVSYCHSIYCASIASHGKVVQPFKTQPFSIWLPSSLFLHYLKRHALAMTVINLKKTKKTISNHITDCTRRYGYKYGSIFYISENHSRTDNHSPGKPCLATGLKKSRKRKHWRSVSTFN